MIVGMFGVWVMKSNNYYTRTQINCAFYAISLSTYFFPHRIDYLCLLTTESEGSPDVRETHEIIFPIRM